jgi:hypothetical protein
VTEATGAQRAQLEQEINQLSGAGKDAKAFAAGLRRNIRNWDERVQADPLASRWLLLDAYIARVLAAEEPGSIFLAERMAFARSVCERLLEESGDAYVGREIHRWRSVCAQR